MDSTVSTEVLLSKGFAIGLGNLPRIKIDAFDGAISTINFFGAPFLSQGQRWRKCLLPLTKRLQSRMTNPSKLGVNPLALLTPSLKEQFDQLTANRENVIIWSEVKECKGINGCLPGKT